MLLMREICAHVITVTRSRGIYYKQGVIYIYIIIYMIGNAPDLYRKVYPIKHYDDVIMTTIASEITSLTSVYSTVYSDADQRKHQSSASLAFVWGIHRDRWIPRTKGQLRGKCFHLMTSSWHTCDLFCLARLWLMHWSLIHWGLDKMAPISQTAFSNVYLFMKMYEFRLACHWCSFLRVKLIILQHWLR